MFEEPAFAKACASAKASATRGQTGNSDHIKSGL
jgi:hypothetical protein